MALSSKKKKEIVVEMQEVREHLDPAVVTDQEGFIKELENLTIELNERLEDRLTTFKSDSLKLFASFHQARPNGVLALAQKERERLRQVLDTFMEWMEPIQVHGFRQIACGAAKDCLDLVAEVLTRRQIMIDRFTGQQLQ